MQLRQEPTSGLSNSPERQEIVTKVKQFSNVNISPGRGDLISFQQSSLGFLFSFLSFFFLVSDLYIKKHIVEDLFVVLLLQVNVYVTYAHRTPAKVHHKRV